MSTPVLFSFLNMGYVIGYFIMEWEDEADRNEQLRQLNRLFSRIGYFPVGLCVMLLLVCFNVLLMPVLYLKNLFLIAL